MPSPGHLLKMLASGIIACGAAGVCLTTFSEELPLTDRDPDLDVRLSVKYNLATGEDPAPAKDLLEQRMKSAGYEYAFVSGQGGSGIIGVQVDDDHLDHALRTFKRVLKDTKSPYEAPLVFAPKARTRK